NEHPICHPERSEGSAKPRISLPIEPDPALRVTSGGNSQTLRCAQGDILEPINRALLSCPAAIDDQGRAGYKGGLVRGQVERSMRDLIRSPHTPNGLASVELPA